MTKIPHKSIKNTKALTDEITSFYRSRLAKTLISAAEGWFFSASFDSHYLIDKDPEKVMHFNPNANSILNKICESDSTKFNKDQNNNYLKQLDYENNLVDKFSMLRKIAQSTNSHLLKDSFKEFESDEKQLDLEKYFDGNSINVVILGGGICGLFLANILKYKLGSKVNVLIFENRVKRPHLRMPFDRSWLTNVRASDLTRNNPKEISELLKGFGKNGYVGLPINLIETILGLSCRKNNIYFLFLKQLPVTLLQDPRIDFYFDATGGRFNGYIPGGIINSGLTVNFPLSKLEMANSGYTQKINLPRSGENKLRFDLNPNGYRHYPSFEKQRIFNLMLKIISVPMTTMRILNDYINDIQNNNLIYLWEGVLKNEINEGMVLINLGLQDAKQLMAVIDRESNLNDFLKDNRSTVSNLEKRVSEMLFWIDENEKHKRLKICRPFLYSPHFNLDQGLSIYNKRKCFPVGDSIFNGNPKLGNGLAHHFLFMNELVEFIESKV